MMVKRVFAILLTAVLILGLSACFGVGTPGAPDSSASVNTPGEEKTQKEETAQAVPSKEASSETAEKGSETVP
ncbi:MAG: ABC transporter substrate-binding protein, partial [Lachnospiraceae bacterium]|nr:ABC transporter substrate-binding protein [Lachnospiraceae bacterium]